MTDGPYSHCHCHSLGEQTGLSIASLSHFSCATGAWWAMCTCTAANFSFFGGIKHRLYVTSSPSFGTMSPSILTTATHDKSALPIKYTITETTTENNTQYQAQQGRATWFKVSFQYKTELHLPQISAFKQAEHTFHHSLDRSTFTWCNWTVYIYRYFR